MADQVAAVAEEEGEEHRARLLRPNNRKPSSGDPSVELWLYRRGTGPVSVFRSGLVGPSRDRLDVRGILARNGLRALFAFKPAGSERGFRIRCSPVGGYSAIPFRDAAVVFLDGDPKITGNTARLVRVVLASSFPGNGQESLMKPVAVIIVAVLVPVVVAAIAVKGVPDSSPLARVVVNGRLFPPWILAAALIILVRTRTRPRS